MSMKTKRFFTHNIFYIFMYIYFMNYNNLAGYTSEAWIICDSVWTVHYSPANTDKCNYKQSHAPPTPALRVVTRATRDVVLTTGTAACDTSRGVVLTTQIHWHVVQTTFRKRRCTLYIPRCICAMYSCRWGSDRLVDRLGVQSVVAGIVYTLYKKLSYILAGKLLTFLS